MTDTRYDELLARLDSTPLWDNDGEETDLSEQAAARIRELEAQVAQAHADNEALRGKLVRVLGTAGRLSGRLSLFADAYSQALVCDADEVFASLGAEPPETKP